MAAELTSGDKASIQEVTGIPSGSLQVSPIAFPGFNSCELFDALDQQGDAQFVRADLVQC